MCTFLSTRCSTCYSNKVISISQPSEGKSYNNRLNELPYKNTPSFMYRIHYIVIRIYRKVSRILKPNSPLWKRVIAWERSRAASGYGLFGETQIETNKRNLVRNVLAWIAFNRTTKSNKVEVIVLDDQKSRELRRIRTTGLAVYLDYFTIL